MICIVIKKRLRERENRWSKIFNHFDMSTVIEPCGHQEGTVHSQTCIPGSPAGWCWIEWGNGLGLFEKLRFLSGMELPGERASGEELIFTGENERFANWGKSFASRELNHAAHIRLIRSSCRICKRMRLTTGRVWGSTNRSGRLDIVNSWKV